MCDIKAMRHPRLTQKDFLHHALPLSAMRRHSLTALLMYGMHKPVRHLMRHHIKEKKERIFLQ